MQYIITSASCVADAQQTIVTKFVELVCHSTNVLLLNDLPVFIGPHIAHQIANLGYNIFHALEYTNM